MRMGQEVSIREVFDELHVQLAYCNSSRKSGQAYREMDSEKVAKKEC